MSRLRFELHATATGSRARAGRFHTLHGAVETPVFMPVGTQATVKGMPVEDLAAAGTQVLLANAYHLLLRPGLEVFERLGGIHRFMNWDGAVLTDSGGFQVFSLPNERVIDEEGAIFKSYVDGTHSSIAIMMSLPIARRPPPRCTARTAGRSAAWPRAATRRRRCSASCRAPASTSCAARAPTS